MATRTSRKSTTTTTTSQRASSATSTPVSSVLQSPGRRPPSPTAISRYQEKEELAGLNDRLASYIDRVRFLETENQRLTTQIRSSEEVVTREVTNIKGLYETELNDARKLLDETSKEKARLQIEVNKYRGEAEEWEKKYKKRDAEAKALDRKLLAAEAQVNDLQTRLSDAVNQRKYWEDEYNKLKAELLNLEKAHALCKKQLEDETVARVDLENRLQSLKEELAFKNQVHEKLLPSSKPKPKDKEINETRVRHETTLHEVDLSAREDYENKLSEAVRQMRDENDYVIRTTREETEEVFNRKLQEVADQASRNDSMAEKARKDLLLSQKRVDELSADVTRLASQIAIYEARIKELESQLSRERDDHQAALDLRDREIRKLREQLADRWQEYQDLLDIKIQLDNEILTYRKLLESEETRLNLSDTQTPSKRGTPGRSTPLRGTPTGGRKRKRTTALVTTGAGGKMFSSASAEASYATSSGGKGEIVIQEVSDTGKYIKLFNNTDEEMALGGWQLKHHAGDNDNTYKFHRTLHIKSKEGVTVWSSDSEQAHHPPDNLVMKNQKWNTAEEMRTSLVNGDGEEVAFMEMKKEQSYMARSYHVQSSEDLETDEGDMSRREEKCAIM